MKKSNIIITVFSLLMLAGCTVDELAGSKDGQIPVRLSVSQEATVTRAADGLYTNTTGFDGTESVEVYVNSSEKHATFTVGAPDGTHKSELTGTLYYPTTGDANLYAVYPSTSTESHTVKYDQTTPANYKASDLMYAKTTVAQEDKDDEQNLEFGHQLVKLKVVIVKAADVSQVTQVMMNNVKRQVSVTLGPSSMTLGTPATATGDEATGGDNILVFSGSNTLTSAQTYAVVFPVQSWSDADFITVTADGKTATYKLTKDNFAPGSEYTLTLNINATALNNTVSITNWTGNESKCEVQPTVTEKQYVFVPEGAIPGLFTINSSGAQVYFSKGNLQYDGTNWKFAEHQYDYIETATGYPMDHFTWGSIDSPTYDGTSYYTANANLSGSTDWGSRMGEGWYTLSSAEWTYLFNTRTNAASKFGYATVAEKHGIIIVPDDFTDPMKNNGSGAFVGSTTTVWTANVYSAENWSAMETAGCVFLPAAGRRNGSWVTNVGSIGYYWSSTANGADYAYCVYFSPGGVNPANDDSGRDRGFSVRLVRPVE